MIPVCGSWCRAYWGQGSECFYLTWSVRLGHIVKGELLNLENTLERLVHKIRRYALRPGVEEKMEGKVILKRRQGFGFHIYLARAHLAARSDCMTLTSPPYLAGGSHKKSFSFISNFLFLIDQFQAQTGPQCLAAKSVPGASPISLPPNPMRVTEDLLTFPRLKFLWLCLLWAHSDLCGRWQGLFSACWICVCHLFVEKQKACRNTPRQGSGPHVKHLFQEKAHDSQFES